MSHAPIRGSLNEIEPPYAAPEIVFVPPSPDIMQLYEAAIASHPATKKARPKRQRRFVLEGRTVPSALGFLFGKDFGPWFRTHAFDKLADARARMEDFEDLRAGFFVRGTEYRIRQTDMAIT